MGKSKGEWRAHKAKLDAGREAARAGEKFIRIRETFPVAGALMAECLDDDKNMPWAGGDSRDGFNDLWPAFVLDISRKAKRYGSISEAQAAAVEKWVPLHREKVARIAAEKAEEAANATPVVEGDRLTIEGEVAALKYQDGYAYGSLDYKMLVKVDGYKLWGTCPRSLESAEVKVGDIVRFVANVEVSNDDPHFGFFKRPSKAEVTSVAEVAA
jgi:hypothetical protein